MGNDRQRPDWKRALRSLETPGAEAASLAGVAASWLFRERFPALPSDDEAWRDIEERELVLPVSDTPEVSILVPVYGKFATTWACLDSLARTAAGSTFEVIVANDCSPDRTLDMLSRVRGVRVVNNTTNLGFVRSNNHAAKEARGKWLCLLNNDTRVTSGWLGPLLRTFEAFPNAGLVGAKLLFPDGKLQEAGGIVFRDAVCTNYGRNRDPRRPEFCFTRPVDYCSAAAVVIPKALWDELGGFDDRYHPAYYEDTDLAFRVRKAGYDVLYQPLSRVVHYEGVTHGRDAKKGLKRHQALNHRRFFDRWRDELVEHHEERRRRTWRSADRRRGPGVLMLTDVEPARDTPEHDAASSAAAAGFRVALWAAESARSFDSGRAELQFRGIEVMYAPYAGTLSSFVRGAGVARFGAALLWNRPDSGKIARLLRKRASKVKLVLALREGEELDTSIEQPDAVCVPSDRERERFATRFPGVPAFILPTGNAAPAVQARTEAWQALARMVDRP
jgi:GT2 family glycosyltransferase